MTTPKIPQIAWSARFETGIAVMDDDHRHLLDLLNSLAHACNRLCHSTIHETLARIESFLLAHFAREEALFHRCNPEHAALHREEHHQMHQEVAHQLDELYSSDHSLASVARLLHYWLLSHISATDRELARLLNTEYPPHAT